MQCSTDAAVVIIYVKELKYMVILTETLQNLKQV